ncbi:Pentatricopeptide repeat-containing protein [Sesamum angolense]|uniref:Pentatricopeptide repeat-containing protein n=1 Tax=Sesamum angolense TaxID=2727404 RepID=A0AAE1X6N4_9LAMI|nr:Pentatricopeptide repeat-containing protein [Sesamum angolense]
MDEMFLKMKHQGLKPNSITYSSLVSAYGKARLLGKVDSILRQVENSDVVLDTPFFNCVINAYGNAGDVERMMELLMAMEGCGCKPDNITFATIIQACRAQGMIGVAQNLESNMTHAKDTSDSQNLSNTETGKWLLADIWRNLKCHKDGDLQKGQAVKNQMALLANNPTITLLGEATPMRDSKQIKFLVIQMETLLKNGCRFADASKNGFFQNKSIDKWQRKTQATTVPLLLKTNCTPLIRFPFDIYWHDICKYLQLTTYTSSEYK